MGASILKGSEKVTQGGIEYKLEKSRFTVEHNGVLYYFSSELHKQKFLAKLAENNKRISESLQDRFNLYVSACILADILLYIKIETRGFLIEVEGVKIWEKTIQFDIVIRTKPG